MSFEKKLKTEAPVEGQEKQELSPEEKSQKEEARHEAIQSAQASLQESAEQDYQVSQKKVKESRAQIYDLENDKVKIKVEISEKNPESGLLNLGIDKEDISALKKELSGLNQNQAYNKINMFLAASIAESLSQNKVEGANFVQQKIYNQINLLKDNENIKSGKHLINLEKFINYNNEKGSGVYIEGLSSKLEKISGYKKNRKGLARIFGSTQINFEEMVQDLSKALGVDNSKLIENVKTGKEPALSSETAKRYAERTHSGSYMTTRSEIKRPNYLVESSN
ncbi:MAG: hypothetical protein ACOXZ1_00875 [Patescibacteria group bacterium]|mgnify:CR=1 FL=1|jgi:hypothetical protein